MLLDLGVSLARLSNPNLIQIFLRNCYIELTNISAQLTLQARNYPLVIRVARSHQWPALTNWTDFSNERTRNCSISSCLSISQCARMSYEFQIYKSLQLYDLIPWNIYASIYLPLALRLCRILSDTLCDRHMGHVQITIPITHLSSLLRHQGAKPPACRIPLQIFREDQTPPPTWPDLRGIRYTLERKEHIFPRPNPHYSASQCMLTLESWLIALGTQALPGWQSGLPPPQILPLKLELKCCGTRATLRKGSARQLSALRVHGGSALITRRQRF